MFHIPDVLGVTVDDDVVSSGCVVGDGAPAGLLHGDVLRADRVLQSLRRLRRAHRRLGRLNHLVVDALIACDINRQRVIAQRLHFVDGQVAVRLIRQSSVLACWIGNGKDL